MKLISFSFNPDSSTCSGCDDKSLLRRASYFIPIFCFSQYVVFPSSQLSSKPSTKSNMLCNAQQVNQTWSTNSKFFSFNSVLKIVNLPFCIPKVHSTSFLIDSNHSDILTNWCNSICPV